MMATLRQMLQAARDVVDTTNERSPYDKTQSALIAYDFLREHGPALTATLDAFDKQWRELQDCKRAITAAKQAEPPAGDGIADLLRTLLQERNHRTDGDLRELAERCLHLSRGDRDLIAMRGSIADDLTQRLAAVEASRDHAMKLLNLVMHDLIAGSQIEAATSEKIFHFIDPINFPLTDPTQPG